MLLCTYNRFTSAFFITSINRGCSVPARNVILRYSRIMNALRTSLYEFHEYICVRTIQNLSDDVVVFRETRLDWLTGWKLIRWLVRFSDTTFSLIQGHMESYPQFTLTARKLVVTNCLKLECYCGVFLEFEKCERNRDESSHLTSVHYIFGVHSEKTVLCNFQ